MVSEALTFLWSAAESFCIFSACQLVESFYPCSQLPGCGWHCWWYRSQISHHTTRFSKLYCWIELEIYWYQVVLISKLSKFHSKALELWIGSIWFLSPPIINEGERWEMEAIFLVNLLSVARRCMQTPESLVDYVAISAHSFLKKEIFFQESSAFLSLGTVLQVLLTITGMANIAQWLV